MQALTWFARMSCWETRTHGSSPQMPGGNKILSSMYGRCLFLQIRSSMRRACSAVGIPAPCLQSRGCVCGQARGPRRSQHSSVAPAVRCSTRTRRAEKGFPLLASPQCLHAAQGRVTSLQLQDATEIFSSSAPKESTDSELCTPKLCKKYKSAACSILLCLTVGRGRKRQNFYRCVMKRLENTMQVINLFFSKFLVIEPSL